MADEEQEEVRSSAGESLREKVILLVLTAVLTGFLFPYVNGRITEQQTRRAEAEAAELARQASVIKAQDELLGELETTLFEYYSHTAAMPWYRTEQPDDEKFARSREAWDAKGWSLTTRLDVLLSRTRRLASPGVYERLRKHREAWDAIDLEVIRLATRGGTPEQWQAAMQHCDALWSETSEVLHAAAVDFQLVPERNASRQ